VQHRKAGRVGPALSRGLSGLPGRGKDLKLGYQLQLAWPRIVGELMAKYLFPVDVSGSKLTIGVTNSTWMQEAEYQRDTLLENIAKELGPKAIQAISFRMLPQSPAVPAKPVKARVGPAPKPPPPPQLSSEQRAHLDEELARIKDPGLREQMRRILEKAFAKNRGA
jgi:hypothetical protein